MKQTKYKDLDDVKMEIRRTEVSKQRAESSMLAHKKEADAYFKLAGTLHQKSLDADLTEGEKELFHKSHRLGNEARELERLAVRAVGRAELKLERLKKLAGAAATPTFEFMGGDCGVCG